MAKKPFTFRISDANLVLLQAMARERNTTASSLIDVAVDEYLIRPRGRDTGNQVEVPIDSKILLSVEDLKPVAAAVDAFGKLPLNMIVQLILVNRAMKDE